MKITIIGGGNIGTLMAAEMAYKGHEVTVYTSNPKHWHKEIEVYDQQNNYILTGTLTKVTSDIKEAIIHAELIWITMPAQMFVETAKKIIHYIKDGQYIGMVPGSGGAEFIFQEVIAKGCTLFGFQRVHSIARLKEYGKSVYMLGRKSNLQIGSIPTSKCTGISKIIESLFDMPCIELPNYLSVTLSPSNPILHTTRLYSMFKDYQAGMSYPRNFLFYEEWDNESSKVLIACDKELQELCNVIPMQLQNVKSLCDYYESHTVEAMTKKISSIQAFKGLVSPMKEVDGCWVPDFESRYFTTDFPYGLKIIKDIGELFEVKMPYINTIWNWYVNITLEDKRDNFIIKYNKNDFVNIYY